MLSSLYEKQNEVLLLKYLVARRRLNSRCKLIFSLSRIVLLFAVVFAFYQSKREITESVVGWYALFLFIAWIVEKILVRIAFSWKCIAAKLQQLFDATVYSVECPAISPTTFNVSFSKSELADVIKGITERDIEKAKVKDWYVGADSLNNLERVLNCQRQSVVWDATQRWIYLGACTIFYIIVGVIGCRFLFHTELCHVLSSLLLVAPFLGSVADGFIDNLKACLSATRILKGIKSIECGNIELNVDGIVTIQARIYNHRLESTYVPDWFYWLCRRFLSDSAKLHARALEEVKHA